ncbi:MAG: YDG domain-containing protein [Clostridiales bacterium]|jgi:hypothetical protein|nr:YDG domain-containing protein [Clostridiales bacterium]
MKRTKAIFFVCIILTIGTAILPSCIGQKTVNGVYAVSTDGADTEWYNPDIGEYYIKNANELEGLALLVNRGITFKDKIIHLKTDIEERTAFTIGSEDKPFEGQFDGGENKIFIGAPLFFTVQNASVKNLFLDAQIIDGKSQDRGMLANNVFDSSVVSVSVAVKYINDSNQSNFGGITAYAKNSLIQNCAVTGVIKKEDGIIGGIASQAESSVIKDCYNNAEITVSYLSEYIIGGIGGKLTATPISGSVNYAPIILKPFFEGGHDVNGLSGSIAGQTDRSSAVSGCFYLDGQDGAVGGSDETPVSAQAVGTEEFKSKEFLEILNEPFLQALFSADTDGYEINGGYPIFVYQIPRPTVAADISVGGTAVCGGIEIMGSFKTQFGTRLTITVKADKYYKIAYVGWRDSEIAFYDDREITFTTDAVYERSELCIRFEKEMRSIELDGISASKVYDGTVSVSDGGISFGEKGLYIKNPYFDGDDIYIANGFDGGDAIRVSFAYPNAGSDGQCLVLHNVQFGGESASYYQIPDVFYIYNAEITKAPLTIYYGGIDPETQLYTPGKAISIYGNEITADKYYGFSVHDDSFMFSGEFYTEILRNGSYVVLQYGTVLPIGDYTLRAGGVTALNYDITFAECLLKILPRQLYVEFDYIETEYGSLPQFIFKYSNFADGDDQSVLTSLPEYLGEVLLAGTHRIILTGGSADNYVIVNLEGIIKVLPKAISVCIDENQCKIYGENERVLTGRSDGLCYGDIILFVRNDGENAGLYRYIGYSIGGAGYDAAASYIVTVINPDEKFEIKKRALTITAKDAETIYGKTARYGFSFENLAPFDTEMNISSLKINIYASEDIGFLYPLDTLLNAGGYLILPYGGVNDNYQISYVSGLLTVQKAVLTFKINNVTVVYGYAYSPDYVVSGFKYNQDASVLDLSGLTFFAVGVDIYHAPAGEYTVTADGAQAQNYYFEYETGIFTVDKAPLYISIKNPLHIVYGDAVNFEFIFEGLVGGDDAEGQLVNLHVPYLLICELQAVMPYAEAANYRLFFNGSTLKIDPKILVLSGIYIADKLYDGTASAVIGGTPILKGLVIGDLLSVSGTPLALFDGVSAGINVPVTVSGYFISGENSHMYELSIPKFFADICINTVSADGITVRSSGSLPSDTVLLVNPYEDLNGLKKDIKRNVGARNIYFAVTVAFESVRDIEGGAKYKIYLPASDELKELKKLKAVVIKNGKYTEVEAKAENGYIVFETDELGTFVLVKNGSLWTVFFLIFGILAILSVIYIVFFRERFKASSLNSKLLPVANNADRLYGTSDTKERSGVKINEGSESDSGIDDTLYEEYIRESIGNDGLTDIDEALSIETEFANDKYTSAEFANDKFLNTEFEKGIYLNADGASGLTDNTNNADFPDN